MEKEGWVERYESWESWDRWERLERHERWESWESWERWKSNAKTLSTANIFLTEASRIQYRMEVFCLDAFVSPHTLDPEAADSVNQGTQCCLGL